MKKSIFTAAGILACFAFLCVSSYGKPEPVTMVLQWEHQAQFAGYYMALEKGFYAEENLEVTLRPGGADVNPLQLVLSGEAQFCSEMLSSALTQSDPQELTLILQLINRCNLTLIAWKKGREEQSPIETPADLTGKKITIWEGFRTPYQQFFTRYKTDPVIIPQYYSLSLFLHKGCDACCAMQYNEYHTLRQLGIPQDELTVFDLYDLGITLPEDGIYCRKEFFKSNPETCSAFARASLRGWKYAKENPQETLDVIMRQIHTAKLPTNRPHMRWMLESVLASIYPGPKDRWIPGKLARADYENALSFFDIEDSAPAFTVFTSPEAAHAEN